MGVYCVVYQFVATTPVGPVRSSITIWSRVSPPTVRKLPITTRRSPSGVSPDSRGPTGAWAPVPVLLWWPDTAMSRNGSNAPVVAFRVASWPRATPPILLKKPPMNSRLPGSISMVWMPPLVDGALKLVTA